MLKPYRNNSVAILAFIAVIGFAGCSREVKKTRHLERANRYFAAEQYEKAEIEYMNVLRLDPRNTNAITRLGLLYYEEGRLSAAPVFLRKAAEFQPDNLEVRLKLGRSYFSAGDFKSAHGEAVYILEKQPASEEALLLLVESAFTQKEIEDAQQRLQKLGPSMEKNPGYLLAAGSLSLRRQDAKNAERAFKQAIALDPKSSAAYQAMGNLYLGQNDPKQADQAFKTASDLAPIRSARRLRYADFKIQSGDPEGARKLLEDITRQAPDYIPAWTRLADLAFAQKKYDDCDALVKRVLSRDGANYDALLLGGRLKLARGEAAKAIIDFERMSKVYSRSPLLQYQLALAHLLNKDPAGAAASLSRATALDPNYTDAVLLLAELDLRKGDGDSAITSLKQLIKQKPQILRAHQLLADAYLTRGNTDEALAVYRRLMELYPKNPQTPLLMGLVLSQQNRKSDARKAFEQSFELAPDYLPALEQLVDLDIADKQYAAALQRVQKRLEKNPRAPEPHYFMAQIYLAQNQTGQAEAALLKAIELQSDFRPAYLLLARVYVASQKHQQALERLQEVATKNPKDTVALMQIGMIHNEMKNYTAARDTYEKLIGINPRFTFALNNLAYLYSERFGKLDRAYELARKARDLQPNDPFATDTLGWILFKRGDYPWALTLIKESADKLPAEPEVQFHLGMAHYMMGEEEPARIALQRAVQLNKEFVGKDEAARRLAVLAIDAKTADARVVTSLEKSLADQPDDPVALARLAAVCERDAAFEKAKSLYEQALSQNSKNLPATIKLAQLYSDRLHNPKRALELAKTAHDLAPEDAAVARALGRLAFQAGDFKWSLSLLEESARKLVADPEVLCDLAWAQYSVGRVADAETTMQNALRPGTAFTRTDEARRFLSFSPLARDFAKAQQATAQIQEALKADPNYAPALMAAAVVYEQQNNLNAARQACEKVLARYPFFAPANKRLAALYAALGDNQKAYDQASKAREALPDDPEVARTLGVVLYQRGDYTRAVQFLKESARKRATDAELFYYLGMAHYRLKEKGESKQALRQALTLNANASFVEEARKVLAELK